MNIEDLPAYAALSLGLLTSISPCPLATNIAAVAFVSRRYKSMVWVATDTSLYAVGRAASYAVLALLIQLLSLRVARVASPLMTVAEYVLGPVLIFVGLVLLNIVRLATGASGLQEKVVHHSGKVPLLSAFLLGAGFALAFCPFSGALYFGGLIPIALKSSSGFLLAVLYGIGTAVPVLGVGLVLAVSLKAAERLVSALRKLDRWTRPAVGVVFVLIGIYEIVLLIRSRL
ncbi:MAG: aromatic aminobenezylarsenical efflux permease ArsG family transporter [Acidobacteriota bacterium]